MLVTATSVLLAALLDTSPSLILTTSPLQHPTTRHLANPTTHLSTTLQVDEVIIACFLSGVLSAAGMAGQNHKALKKSVPKSLGAFVVLLCAGLLVVVTSPFPRPSRL